MAVTQFGGIPLSISGARTPGAVLRLQSKSGNVVCDTTEPPPSSPLTRFQYTQSAPAAVWVVNHNLGFRPSVTLYSLGSREMLGEIVHTSLNQTVVYFDNPTAGLAVCI